MTASLESNPKIETSPAPTVAAGRAREPKLLTSRLGRSSVSFLRARWRSLLLIGFVILVLVLFKAVLTPFIVAFALAYVLYPAVQRLARLQIRGAHLPVWVSILIVYIVLIGGASTFGALAMPPVLAQLQKLIDNIPRYAEQADRATNRLISRLEGVLASWERRGEESAKADEETVTVVDGEPVLKRGSDAPSAHSGEVLAPRATNVGDAIRDVIGDYRNELIEWLKRLGAGLPALVEGLARSIFSFFLVLMLTFMFLVYFPTLFDFARALIPTDYRPEFEKIAREVNHRLAGVVRGQLLICLVNGILTYIGFAMIGVKFASLLAFVAGVMSLIPIFGTIISTIPAALIGLTDSLAVGLSVVGWVVIIHMLEAYVLNPKIMGDSAHMNPLLIVFALLVGSHYFHPVLGPLLAAPISAIIQTVFLHFLTRADHVEPEAEPSRPSGP